MITVVHVITKLEMGGAQENTLYTSRCLDRSKFRVALVYGPGGYYDAEAAAIPELRRVTIPELTRDVHPRADLVATARLGDLFRALREEHRVLGLERRRFIVHTHSSKAGVLGRAAAKAAGVPRIVHTIHGFGFHPWQHPVKQRVFEAAERIAARATDAFISVSEANLAEAVARGIVRPGKHRAEVIRSGFDLAPYLAARPAERRASARARLGVAEDREVVVVVANFKPQKDPLTMVEAIRLVAATRPKVLCLYAGDGELRDAVQAAIAAGGVAQHFRLLGWRTDVPELLAAADVVALASIFEGLPRSAVQAVAAGRPFVGTRVDGTPEIIRDGRNGYLVEPKDPLALARAIEKALVVKPVDPADVEFVRAWDADAMVRSQEALYEAIV